MLRGGSLALHDQTLWYAVPRHALGLRNTIVYPVVNPDPGAGSRTYTLNVIHTNGTNINLRCSSRFLFVINQKK